MMRRIHRRCLLLAAMLSGAWPAQAGTATTSFNVTATVEAACTVSATDLSFGTYTATGGALDGSSSVTVTCSSGAAYQVGLGEGMGTGATAAARRMTSGTNQLRYGLYQDAGRGTVWGTGAGAAAAGTGSGAAQTLTVYGRIPGNQMVPAGSYADVIVVTVDF